MQVEKGLLLGFEQMHSPFSDQYMDPQPSKIHLVISGLLLQKKADTAEVVAATGVTG